MVSVRFLIVVVIVCVCTSCELFTKKKTDPTQKLDSISFTTVDTAPSFQVCDSIFEKVQKNDCFRNTMYLEITKSLERQEVKVKKDIDEIIQVIITIGSDKTISLKSIEASQNVYVQIPDLQKIIEKSILDLPKVFPARKRGIPVTSEYILPIRVQLKN